jgi:hypothetical protein
LDIATGWVCPNDLSYIKNINNAINDLLNYVIGDSNFGKLDYHNTDVNKYYIIPKRTIEQDYAEYTNKLTENTNTATGGSKKKINKTKNIKK